MPRILRALALLPLLAAALTAQAPLPAFTVVHPDGREVAVPAATIAAMPRVSGEAAAHGHRFTFEGVALAAVLKAAGVTPVDSLRAGQLRRVVTFHGADGYRAVIALSDLDPSIGGRSVVLVEREDGAALPDDRGPRRIIVVGDARPSRWVRQAVRVTVSDLP